MVFILCVFFVIVCLCVMNKFIVCGKCVVCVCVVDVEVVLVVDVSLIEV